MTTGGICVPRGHRIRGAKLYDPRMAGELRPIGTRPTLVAAFDPPGAAEAFLRWQEEHAAALATVPAESLRVEYGRAAEGGLVVRVRIDEQHVPGSLAG
jgi:hypothetical protein